MLRPSGVSSARLESCAASASSASVTPSTGMNSTAWRLPSVMVPVLSSSSVLTSPGRFYCLTAHREHVVLHHAVHPRYTDRREQPANRCRYEAHQQRDQHDNAGTTPALADATLYCANGASVITAKRKIRVSPRS